MRRKGFAWFAASALVLAWAGSAFAHQGWVQAGAPIVPVGEVAYVDLLFGNHSNGHRSYRIAGKWNLKEAKVYVTSLDGPKTDITGRAFDTGEDAEQVGPKGVKGYYTASFVPEKPGLYAVWVQGDSLFKHGDATTRTLRSAKTFVAAAALPSRDSVAHLGAFTAQITPDRLEVVPLFNPAAVTPGQRLNFLLTFKGKPAADQTVDVIRRSTAEAVYLRTDASGYFALDAGEPDYYLVTSHINTDEKEAGKYDQTTYEATLTFVVQRGAQVAAETTDSEAHQHDLPGMDQGAGMADHGHGGHEHGAAAVIPGLEIRVNGKVLAAHWEIKNGRAYVPVEALARALGLTVAFNPKKPEHGVTLQRKGRYVHLHMDDYDAHVDGKTVKLDSPAVYLMGGGKAGSHPMAPIRFVSEAFGGKLAYRPATAAAPATITVTLAP